MDNQNQTENFDYLFEPGWSKTLSIVFSGLTSLVAALAVYSIIWFERHGSDNRRTIQVCIDRVRLKTSQ